MADGDTTAILMRWNAGDANALNEILALHGDWLREHASKKLGERLRRTTETGDIVQDAMLRFLRSGPRLKPRDGAQFRGLLGRIITNVLCDAADRILRLRRELAREHPMSMTVILDLTADDHRAPPPDEAAARAEEGAQIRLVIELLHPDDSEVIRLRSWERLEYSQIGLALGVSGDAARMKFRRASERLRLGLEALRRRDVDTLLAVTAPGPCEDI